MRVFDTSAWIEKLVGSPLGLKLDKDWPPPRSSVVPTLVQLELARWLTRERSEELADLVIAYSMTCIVVPLDTAIALRAAELGRIHKLSTADAIIYATALSANAELVTCDSHFETLPRVVYIAKP